MPRAEMIRWMNTVPRYDNLFPYRISRISDSVLRILSPIPTPFSILISINHHTNTVTL